MLGVAYAILLYASPFFLKKILESLSADSSTLQGRTAAYVYVLMAFGTQLLRSEIFNIRVWCERRMSVRVKAQLATELFKKTLVRYDSGGIGESELRSSNGKVYQLMGSDTTK